MSKNTEDKDVKKELDVIIWVLPGYIIWNQNL